MSDVTICSSKVLFPQSLFHIRYHCMIQALASFTRWSHCSGACCEQKVNGWPRNDVEDIDSPPDDQTLIFHCTIPHLPLLTVCLLWYNTGRSTHKPAGNKWLPVESAWQKKREVRGMKQWFLTESALSLLRLHWPLGQIWSFWFRSVRGLVRLAKFKTNLF